MSITAAPLSLPLADSDRPHSSMSYHSVDERNYQNGRPYTAGSTHSDSSQTLNSAVPRGLPPQSPSYPSPLGSAPGSSHGYPPPPMSAPYPPPPAAYGMPQPDAQDPAAGGKPTNFTSEGQPIVPVGISGGKMYRCRGFGDCDKVFTRSEHLARHVRKHTGERPFPCHCGKAFSRLDNLRQHAATVHADQTQLNETMLASLAAVHAALSQRANREQRRRGEVVEVPKNAIERPRGERTKGAAGAPGQHPGGPPPPGGVYPAPGYHQPGGWGAPPPDHGRPRTAGGGWMEYPPYPVGGEHPPGTASSGGYPDDAGPSRRPTSSAGGYPPHAEYYQQGPPGSSHSRPPTANAPPGTSGSDESASQVPYPYRPVSSGGREVPVPGHYADSEPPSSAHGPPPHSPMYPHPGSATLPPTGGWTSSPTPHSGYPPADPSLYPQTPGGVPPADGQHPYPHGQDGHYGPPPPGSSGSNYYNYGPQGPGYYGQQSPAQAQHATFGSMPPTPGSAGAPYPPNYNGPAGESPFQYNASGPYPYGPGAYDTRKRRADEDAGGDRKHARNGNSADAGERGAGAAAQGQAQGDPLWLPPATERRTSLAISALLGSPTESRSRPATAGEMGYPYPYEGEAKEERPASAEDKKE